MSPKKRPVVKMATVGEWNELKILRAFCRPKKQDFKVI
jgi:hypothetical protein